MKLKGQNEAERTNSAIGDSVVDGSAIEWEKYKQFEGLSPNEKEAFSVKKFEELEKRRMEKNAWHVSKILVERNDGVAVLSERITAYLSEEQDKLFFFNQEYLLQYYAATGQDTKMAVSGAAYFTKILEFFHSHYRIGELFMEFVKLEHKDECNFYHTWSGIPVKRVPQPVPDHTRPGHYQNVSTTPSHENGTGREVDDWQPRANIMKLFASGELSLEKEDRVKEFSEKYIANKESLTFQLLRSARMRESYSRPGGKRGLTRSVIG